MDITLKIKCFILLSMFALHEIGLSQSRDTRSGDSVYHSEDFSGDGSDELEEVDDDIDWRRNEHYLSTLPVGYEIVYPVQYRKNQLLPTLDTHEPEARLEETHYSHTTFVFVLKGQQQKLRLALNKELLADGLQQKRNINSAESIIEQASVEACAYQGYLRKVPRSRAAFTTCHGLRGVILLQNESYAMEPLLQREGENKTIWPHVLYRTGRTEEKLCGIDDGLWEPYQELHMGEFLRRIKIRKTHPDEILSWETKHLQLALILDHSMFVRHNESLELILDYAVHMTNIVSLLYSPYNISIRLLLVEAWNFEDKIAASGLVKETLENVMLYRQHSMLHLKPDVTVFTRATAFENKAAGLAIPDSICTDRSVAVVQDSNPGDPIHNAAVVAHMIAHILGVRHDGQESCRCEDSAGCLMQEIATGSGEVPPSHFSSCSVRDLNGSVLSGLTSCLDKQDTEITFAQSCGNGKIERGEECDCGADEDCSLKDPCCDARTCLLKPWATCRHGDCCYNCTVLPANQLCRAPSGECDVPEYCDGVHGACAHDVMVQDGQPCQGDQGYCYRGECQTLTSQCQCIWGEGAESSDQKCYEEFNPHGTFNGHCGFNSTTGSYTKCEDRDVQCGLLHCMEGSDTPRFEDKKTFSTTHVVSNGHQYQCKILNDVTETRFPVGMVRDGTRCGVDSLCVGQACVAVETVMTSLCPKGSNGVTCSGNGVCTNEAKCFCFHMFMGEDCGVKVTLTSRHPVTTPKPIRVETNVTLPGNIFSFGNVVTTTSSADKTTALLLVTEGHWTTTSLIVVLAGVALAACLCFAFCMLCYRRKSPHKVEAKKKKKFGSAILFVPSTKSDSGSEIVDLGSRVISFGKLPSYKKEKMKSLRKSLGAQSETGSEHSQGSQRDSTELKALPPLPPAPPERGILKKQRTGRSLDNLKRASRSCTESAQNEELEPLQMRNTFEPPRNRYFKHGFFGTKGTRLSSSSTALPLKDSIEYRIQLQQQLQSREPAYSFFPGASPMFQRPDPIYQPAVMPRSPEGDYMVLGERDVNVPKVYERIENATDFENESECTCSSVGKESFCDLGDLSDLEDDFDNGNDSKDQETQTDDVLTPDSVVASLPRDESADSLQGTKNRIKKLKNINDLLKQIDAQFNTVLQQTQNADLSPVSSEATNCSETEADRQIGDQFYKQDDASCIDSDIESPVSDGYEGDNTATLQVRGNCEDRPDKNGLDDQINEPHEDEAACIVSPEPLPTPSCVLSPVRGFHSPPSVHTPPHSLHYMQKTSTPKDYKCNAKESAPLSQKFTLTPQRKPFAVSSTSAFNRLPKKDPNRASAAAANSQSPATPPTIPTENRSGAVTESVSAHFEGPVSQQNSRRSRSPAIVSQSSPKQITPQSSPKPSPRKLSLKLQSPRRPSTAQPPEQKASSTRSHVPQLKSGSPARKPSPQRLGSPSVSAIPRPKVNLGVSPQKLKAQHDLSPSRSPSKPNLRGVNSSASLKSDYLSKSSEKVTGSEQLTAVPYRGAKNVSSSSLASVNASSPPKPDGLNDSQRPKVKQKPVPPPRGPSLKNKSTPLGSALSFHKQLSSDQNSEGYHSDKADDKLGGNGNANDSSVILREIPQKPLNLGLSQAERDLRLSKEVSSPEDVHV